MVGSEALRMRRIIGVGFDSEAGRSDREEGLEGGMARVEALAVALTVGLMVVTV